MGAVITPYGVQADTQAQVMAQLKADMRRIKYILFKKTRFLKKNILQGLYKYNKEVEMSIIKGGK